MNRDRETELQKERDRETELQKERDRYILYLLFSHKVFVFSLISPKERKCGFLHLYFGQEVQGK